VVQSCERLNEHVDTLIPEFVTASSEHVKGIVRIKIIVPVEVTPYKVMNLLLGLLVQVLELVDSGELGDVETIGKDAIRLALKQML
jgi:hypothetical protein